MFKIKQKKMERKEGRERIKPPKHRFKSICVFDEFDVGREGEFIVGISELGNVLLARKRNCVWGWNLGFKRKCGDFSKHEREPNLKCPCKGVGWTYLLCRTCV